MILLDANLLLHAYFPRSEHHERARSWLEGTLSGPGPVFLWWVTILAFLRISTNPKVFERPLTMAEAASIVSSWLALPTVSILEPGERYWEILRELAHTVQVSGPLVMDAALAALALEHGLPLYTTDRDFSRFPGLRPINPLDG